MWTSYSFYSAFPISPLPARSNNNGGWQIFTNIKTLWRFMQPAHALSFPTSCSSSAFCHHHLLTKDQPSLSISPTVHHPSSLQYKAQTLWDPSQTVPDLIISVQRSVSNNGWTSKNASFGLISPPLPSLPQVQTIPPSQLPTSFSINTSVCCLSHSLNVPPSQHCYLCTANMPGETKFKCTLIAASALECVWDLPKGNCIFKDTVHDDNFYVIFSFYLY